MNVIGTQLHDPINSGLAQWRMAVYIYRSHYGKRDESREQAPNSASVSGMRRLTRNGTAEAVTRDQNLRREWGQGNVHFSCSADHERDWQPYPVDPYSSIIDDQMLVARVV